MNAVAVILAFALAAPLPDTLTPAAADPVPPAPPHPVQYQQLPTIAECSAMVTAIDAEIEATTQRLRLIGGYEFDGECGCIHAGGWLAERWMRDLERLKRYRRIVNASWWCVSGDASTWAVIEEGEKPLRVLIGDANFYAGNLFGERVEP